MTLKSEVDQVWAANIESGNIRYEVRPQIPTACVVGASAQIFAAAGSPAVPWWVCGFKISVATGIVLETGWTITLGYGGADNAATAGATPIATGIYFGLIGAAAASMGGLDWCMFPYPIQIPVDQATPGSRMAYTVVANPVGGANNCTACYVLIATLVGG